MRWTGTAIVSRSDTTDMATASSTGSRIDITTAADIPARRGAQRTTASDTDTATRFGTATVTGTDTSITSAMVIVMATGATGAITRPTVSGRPTA